ncbi:MAG: hypothetical protein PHW55_00405 [Methanothrix sp.]|nr:hypothetical protein [Methanothrix harundinacea]MDD5767032.1 hypothetical protein [Methanothrix sp.]
MLFPTPGICCSSNAGRLGMTCYEPVEKEGTTSYIRSAAAASPIAAATASFC